MKDNLDIYPLCRACDKQLSLEEMHYYDHGRQYGNLREMREEIEECCS